MSEAEMRDVYAAHGAFAQQLSETGAMRGDEELKPTDSATTLRLQGGRVVATDGPFAETKEQLTGFYMIEARDLDEAIRIAADIPPARVGCIEVRPIRPIRETVAGDAAGRVRSWEC